MARRAPGITEVNGKGSGAPWRARYRDADGKEHQKQFRTWAEARDWRNEQLAAVRAGSWIDPALGRDTVRTYAEKWMKAAGHREQTRRIIEYRLRLHVYPTLGERPLADLRHTELRAWLTELEKTLAPWTVYGIQSALRSVLNSAVADRVIVRSPFERIPLKAVHRVEPVVPMTVLKVRKVLEHAPPTYRALFALGAATGLRGSELRGLDVADIDFLRKTLSVRRQLVTAKIGEAKQAHAFGPPKTTTSIRTLDVPQWALDVVSAHLARCPPKELVLPVVDTPREKERTARLVFTTGTGRPISRTNLHATWNRTLERAGLANVKGQGPHALRHHVASLLIAAGESVKVVQAQLGHASAGETWDTYSHIFPDTEGRVRAALEAAWEADQEPQAGSMRVLDEG
jgi:integrase